MGTGRAAEALAKRGVIEIRQPMNQYRLRLAWQPASLFHSWGKQLQEPTHLPDVAARINADQSGSAVGL